METISSRYPSPLTQNPYQLDVEDLGVHLDVLSFDGEEYLSKPFCYTIRFTCAEPERKPGRSYKDHDPKTGLPLPKPLDLDKDRLLRCFARFAIYDKARKKYPWEEKPPKHDPLREIFGFITSFQRTGGSVEEGHYQITLEPRLALLDRGKQYRLYRHKSVPEIVKHVLVERNRWFPHQIDFLLAREYPRREQVMQYGESDLHFVQRLLAEVGIWYRIGFDSRHLTDVVHCGDFPHSDGLEIHLPLLPGKGMSSPGQDNIWDLATHHQVVEKEVYFRSYDPRKAAHGLYAQTEIPGTVESTHGQTYEYAMPYTELGVKGSQLPGPVTETGHFFARLVHQRNQNLRTQLSGVSSSPVLMPAHLLIPEGNIPKDFAKKVLIHSVATKGGRRVGFTATFKGIPLDEFVGFRPTLLAKPVIAGTIPARISSTKEYARYAHLNPEGRYRVRFHFDRDEHERGFESAWLRQARPYAGEKYGFHLPLIAGTEVAIAFERGDPDRPYIAHALHDSKHPDHVNDDNFQRNVLRTPANNKLRMEDKEGEEHVKLSTEFAGKSQLNLGHLVDNKLKKRGEGFELRTDHWGALRAGKGLFISADAQPKAQGDVLDMQAAIAQLTVALELAKALAQSAGVSGATVADTYSQQELKKALNGLEASGLLASAPGGMALTTARNLQLSSAETLTATAGDSADFSVFKRFSVAAGEAISLFAQKLGLKIFAARGAVEIQAQSDAMTLQADKALTLNSINGDITLNAEQGITLVSRGAYIKLKDGSIEIGAPGEVRVRNDQTRWGGTASLERALKPMVLEDPVFRNPTSGRFRLIDTKANVAKAYSPYVLRVDGVEVARGVSDADGFTQFHHDIEPKNVKVHFD